MQPSSATRTGGDLFDSEAERKLADALARAGLRVYPQWKVPNQYDPGYEYFVDIAYLDETRGLCVAIEIDGEFKNGDAYLQRRMERRDRWFTGRCWHVLRFRARDCHAHADQCAAFIKRYVAGVPARPPARPAAWGQARRADEPSAPPKPPTVPPPVNPAPAGAGPRTTPPAASGNRPGLWLLAGLGVALLAWLILVNKPATGQCDYAGHPSADTRGGGPPRSGDPVIKGNISSGSGERIYHVPGGRFYANTAVSEAAGERWFCTEAEARNAGWRRSSE